MLTGVYTHQPFFQVSAFIYKN